MYPLRGVSINDLRHAHGTAHTAEGTDVRTLANRLGHSTPNTTLRVYSHSVTSAERAAALATDEWLSRRAGE